MQDNSDDVISFDDVSHHHTDEVEGTLNHVTLITQGVVTLIRCIEPFVTGIKMNSMDQEVILTKSSDQ